MHKMWFNTGVKPENRDYNMGLMPHQEWRGGVLQIAFYLETAPPDGWVFKYASPYLIPDEKYFIKIVDGGLFGEYAYFKTMYKHTEWCQHCDGEAEYSTNPLVAVKCPLPDCDDPEAIHIHCDACVHYDVPYANGGDCKNCPWHDEACPHSGAMVRIHDKRPDDHKALCPCGCGMEFTVFEHKHSWED